MRIGEFFIQLGVKADVTKVKDFVRAISNLPVETAGAILAIGGIQYKLAQLAQQAFETAVGLQHFTMQTGLSAQELQRWQVVGEQANVSAEAVASSVSNLQRQMAEIRLGRGNISPFQMLGIGVDQDAFGVLRQLRSRIKSVDPATFTNIISQMGLSPEMVNLLKLSNVEFEKMSRLIKVLSVDQENTFIRTRMALVQFGQVIRYTAFEHIETMIRAMEKMWYTISKSQTAFMALGAAILALGVYFLPVTAAVVGLMLLLDDLATYFTGGDSLIGRAISGIKKLGEEMKKSLSPENAVSATQQALQKTLSAMIMGPLVPFAAVAAPGIAGIGAMTGNAGNVFNIVVNGTANATEVAQKVIDEVKKAFGHAEQQTNNQGH